MDADDDVFRVLRGGAHGAGILDCSAALRSTVAVAVAVAGFAFPRDIFPVFFAVSMRGRGIPGNRGRRGKTGKCHVGAPGKFGI
ncbi:hypothetical protein NL676_015373 [Syzygium grande]|nr:hypothetical protein NL676_015373 [Syzygium grande]